MAWTTDGWVMAAMSLLVLVFLWRTDATEAVLPLVAYLGTLALHYAGKILVDRPRPEFVDWNPAFASGSAYPSGHALESTAVWGVIVYVASRYSPPALRPWLWWVLGIMVLFQGLNRLYFGLHWTSDVVVAWIAGAAWGATCIWAARGVPRRAGAGRTLRTVT